jgi:hypothetical protein
MSETELRRVTGVAGVTTVVVVIGASLVDGYQNMPVTATTPQIVSFFRSLDDALGWSMSYATSLGIIACLWFAVGLALVLRPYDDTPPWRSAFLAAAGVIGAVSAQIASWDAAIFRADTIDPGVATYAFDLGSISFANSWVATGAVGVCAGSIMLRQPGPGLPRWLAWWGLVAGGGEILARAFFRHDFATAPLFLYWTWVLVLSLVLLSGRSAVRQSVPSEESV